MKVTKFLETYGFVSSGNVSAIFHVSTCKKIAEENGAAVFSRERCLRRPRDGDEVIVLLELHEKGRRVSMWGYYDEFIAMKTRINLKSSTTIDSARPLGQPIDKRPPSVIIPQANCRTLTHTQWIERVNSRTMGTKAKNAA
jgi:hypothetical protein